MIDLARTIRSAPGDPVFKKRVLSALILGPVSLVLIGVGGQIFSMFCAAFAAAMAWEWVSMSDKTAPPRAYALATGTAVGTALLAMQPGVEWVALWIGIGTILCVVDRKARGGMIFTLVGLLYITISVFVFVFLRNGLYGNAEVILFLLVVVWAADIFAYLVGSWLGGPKLLPVASPNKTWAGLAAGLVFGVGAGVLYARTLGNDVIGAALLAMPLAIAAVLGDLIMSLAKRRFGVKDAGTLIPGHGGVLDRVDALMMGSIFAGIIILVVPEIWPGMAL